MNPNQDEEQIKKLFLDLRRKDEQRAPAFEEVWSAASSRRRRRRREYVWRAAAALAALALLGVTVALVFHQRTLRYAASALTAPVSIPMNGSQFSSLPWQSTVLISQWRSPTDFLLRSPGEQLLQPISPREKSAIRGPAQTLEERN